MVTFLYNMALSKAKEALDTFICLAAVLSALLFKAPGKHGAVLPTVKELGREWLVEMGKKQKWWGIPEVPKTVGQDFRIIKKGERSEARKTKAQTV